MESGCNKTQGLETLDEPEVESDAKEVEEMYFSVEIGTGGNEKQTTNTLDSSKTETTTTSLFLDDKDKTESSKEEARSSEYRIEDKDQNNKQKWQSRSAKIKNEEQNIKTYTTQQTETEHIPKNIKTYTTEKTETEHIPKPVKEGVSPKTNRTYRFYKDKKTYSEAREFCNDFSNDLAIVHNEQTHNFVTTLADEPFWIGGQQYSNFSWLWTNGFPIINYKPFEKQEPLLKGCLEVNGRVWNERDCNETKSFMCQPTVEKTCMWCL